jgi:hypothetical protein
MASSFATYFNERARPVLHRTHAEVVVIRNEVAGDTEVSGVWKRALPDGGTEADGLGLQAYDGMATLVVKLEDMPTPPLVGDEIIREDETWTLRHAERQDEWTWILHLSRPRDDQVMPARMRT